MAPSPTSRTDANLQVALAGEADANRRYIAYGFQALTEGRPEIAQLFFEAAGAETVHALTHLKTMGAIGSTHENLERAAVGEMEEIDVILPRMIQEAEAEGHPEAAASFRLALERERHHRDMFRTALKSFHGGDRGSTATAPPPAFASTAVTSGGGDRAPVSDQSAVPVSPAPASDAAVAPAPGASGGADVAAASIAAGASPAAGGATSLRTRTGRAHAAELLNEPRRIERLSSIREVVFGAQDGLMSTFAVVAGLAAANANHVIIVLAGLVSAVAGVLAMSIGTFLSSRAQRQVYEAELARERREIHQHPGEEIAELIASLTSRGMSRMDAVEVGRRIARHGELLLAMLGVFELGLAPQRLGTPVRDAFVMAVAFGVSALVPVLPFLLPHPMIELGLASALTVIALFAVGAIKGRLAHVSMARSGLEVVALGLGSGLIGFGLGRLASLALGVEIGG